MMSRRTQGRRAHAWVAACFLTATACSDLTPDPLGARSPLADSSTTSFAAITPVPVLGADAALLGGNATTFDFSSEAFEQPHPNLSAVDVERHDAGDEGFGEVFTPATGLGPHFNNASCEGCHFADGRGELPDALQPLTSMLLRLSIPGSGPNGEPVGIPGFGDQLQPNGVAPVPGEANVRVTHSRKLGAFADGMPYELLRPEFVLKSGHRPLPTGYLVSPRVAPQMVGLGLLEAIPASTIMAMADEFDVNGDGISGRANMVWDPNTLSVKLGRFGVKANTPTMRQQSAGAYNGDMGITTPMFPHESCETFYSQCSVHSPEVNDSVLSAVTFYGQTLGVPARRNMNDVDVRLGQALFTAVGCASCHTPILRTGILPGVPSASNQLIRPHTDMLIHDMGPELADNRPDFGASGREWRTAPLWGGGLTKVVNPRAGYLHDGRARNATEAILWHGGEGQKSRDNFRSLPASQRDALLKYLGSL